jgi:hypothetical protein
VPAVWSTALPGLGKRDLGFLRFEGIVASGNEFCKSLMSKDTIATVESGAYESIGGHKHSLDQDTTFRTRFSSNLM